MPSVSKSKTGAAPATHAPGREPPLEWLSSLVGFFVYLLVLKSFLVPLFVIPTGSMAPTLMGAHSVHTCPNCGFEYPVGQPLGVLVVQCPNCRWREYGGPPAGWPDLQARGVKVDSALAEALPPRGGDRIMVHGWTYDLGGRFAPQRWDVVVFKVPTDGWTNYIKRLIGRPGETIELINGDVFVGQDGGLDIARKPHHVQETLWFPYFDQDHPPRQPSASAGYHPRWASLRGNNGWSGLDTRHFQFTSTSGARGTLQFLTNPGSTQAPGFIGDVYGYNPAYVVEDSSRRIGSRSPHVVNDVRLSCTVECPPDPPADGFVELELIRYNECYFARLYGDGRVTLEHAPWNKRNEAQDWGQAAAHVPTTPVRLALSVVDYTVIVELDGQPALRRELAVDADQARKLSLQSVPPTLHIAAQGLAATLSHVLIERDVYYTNDKQFTRDGREIKSYGTQNNPIALRENEYFVLGDNSPSSLDARYAFAQKEDPPVGPHLVQAAQRGEFRPGTVPADQLIGPAFFVYWPGTGPLLPPRLLPTPLRVLNQNPSIGRVRWID